MIYKDNDNKEPILAVLGKMLAAAGAAQQAQLAHALAGMRAERAAERDSARLLDFHLKDSTRTAVIHELRLVADDGEAALFDHLLIHRMARFTILDTRHFCDGLKVTEQGDFLRWDAAQMRFEPLPSPLARSARQVRVLRQVLASIGQGEAAIESLLLAAPDVRIERPRRFDTSMLVKPDRFMERLNKSLEATPIVSALGGLLRTGESDSIGDIAKKLVKLHRPSGADYLARFGIRRQASAARADSPEQAGGKRCDAQALAADSMRST